MNTNQKVNVSSEILALLEESLQKITGGYGSVEIIVQDHAIKQINTREITKTNQPIVYVADSSI